MRRSLSWQVGRLIKKATKQAFNYTAPETMIKHVKPGQNQLYETDVGRNLESKYRQDGYKAIEQYMTPKYVSGEIIDMVEGVRDYIYLSSDSQGTIQVKLKDAFLEKYMNDIIKKNNFFLGYLQSVKASMPSDPKKNTTIIYPLLHMCNPISPDDFRRWWFSEVIARVNEQLHENKVARVQCLHNNSSFAGVVMAYILEKKAEGEISMEQIAQFLIYKYLKTEEDINNFGTLTISQKSVDKSSAEVFDGLYSLYFANREALFGDTKQIQYFTSESLKVDREGRTIQKMLDRTESDRVYTTHLVGLKEYKLPSNIYNIGIGAVETSYDRAIDLIKIINRDIGNRLKVNMPEVDAEIQTGLEKRWLKYYLSLWPRDKSVRVDLEQITSLVFTKGEERREVHLKLDKMQPQPFKVADDTDREICNTVCRVGDHFERLELDKVHEQVMRLQKLLKRKESYGGLALLRSILDRLYDISGVS